MTTLHEKLIKIGTKMVRHGRYVTLQLAEVVIPRRLLAGDPAFDRRPRAEASTDVTPYVIDAVGWNRRPPGPRHLPNGRLLALDCNFTRFRARQVIHPKPPNRDKRPRFRPMLDCATVLGGREESFGKSQVK